MLVEVKATYTDYEEAVYYNYITYCFVVTIPSLTTEPSSSVCYSPLYSYCCLLCYVMVCYNALFIDVYLISCCCCCC